MNLLDRLMIRGYLKAYLICLISLLSLYVVVDLFTNLDSFTEKHKTLREVLVHIGTYYGYRLAQIFDLLCEAIVVLAATFTVAWLQRHNELLPLLSAGVPTRRIVLPILLTACAVLGVTVANQELIIPRIGAFLMNSKEDPAGEREMLAQGMYEPSLIHIEGKRAQRRDKTVHDFYVVIPESLAGSVISLYAKEAKYIPPGTAARSGGWLMTGAKPEQLENWDKEFLTMIDPGKYFLHTREVDFDALTRNRNWYVFASTARLHRELSKPESARLAPMAVLFHMRLTRPILGMILVVMGISIILRDQNRNVFLSAGMCLALCALFFTAKLTCKSLGDYDYLSPAFAAWLPVLCFGPLGLVMFDAIHT